VTGSLPECVTRDPPGSVRASVIWLHGLGADGHDFEPIVPELRLPEALGVRFVFPHAPVRPVTLNGGMRMRAWFDVRSLERGGAVDLEGIGQAARSVCALIADEQARGVPAARIVLAGFSQGGAMALHVGLRHGERLAGIMGLSTFLPTLATLERERDVANVTTPVFLAHGQDDPLIPLESAQMLQGALAGLGYAVEYHEYPMAHAVCAPEIRDIAAWLARALA
jgi:phospholipase/carboxylesterase